MPKFTIITAVKNGLDDLKRTYTSLANQMYKDFEWIVIDSNSHDGTAEWLRTLNKSKINLVWVSEPDLGIADAYNKGIRKSIGEYILILNAGDTYDSDLLSVFANYVGPSVIVCSHARLLSLDGKNVGIFKSQPRLLWRGMHLAHNWCCVPRSIYVKQGDYKLMPHALDYEWFYRFYRENGVEQFCVVDRVLGCYYLGGHSDNNYKKGFLANRKIFIDSGMNIFIANFICYAYILRHSLRKLLLNLRTFFGD